MKLVEQAIFTSIETDREAGYRVVASSKGVCEADARELAVWEPSRDAMIDPGPDAESFNFHPLPSGAYCISRSTPAGWERGGGQRVQTHCLIVPPQVLARFANNPFSLIAVMSEKGLWRSAAEPCPHLGPLMIPEGTTLVDQALLGQLAIDPGPEHMALLVHQALNAVCLAIAGAHHPQAIIAGLFSCLPAECRLEFSFSTGLKFSPWRPFRIVTLSDDPAEHLWVASYSNVLVLEMGPELPPGMFSRDGWATLIERTLANNQIAFLAAQISKQRIDLSLEDLPALGLQLLESLECPGFLGDDESAPESRTLVGQRAHAAHRQFQKTIATAMATLSATPKGHVTDHPPEILDKLEHLDDLVYEAISGQVNSLQELRVAWPKLLHELGEDMLADSREQYMRYALSIWDEYADAHGVRDPARAVQALDILCLLFSGQK